MNSKKTHILVVEDENPLREILSNKLIHEGFKVTMAKNGQEALEHAQADVPDLVLLDIIMPVMDGITALKKMREMPKLKNVKVILLTNVNDSEKIATAMEHKFSDYIIKSDFDLPEIINKINSVLQAPQMAQT